MEHFFIISGGQIEDEFAVSYLREKRSVRIIAADSGMEFLYRNGIIPEAIIGDFDSVSEQVLSWFRTKAGIVWHELNPEKDDTDTEYAVRLAVRMGAEKITVLGATGSRLDHILGNLELLGIGLEHEIPMEIVDAHNRVRMIRQGIKLNRAEQFGTYISLIPYSEPVEHLYLTGFKYPLADYCLKGFCSIGVSNEIIEEVAEISFQKGILFLIESKDR